MKIVFATHNQHKLKEVQAMLPNLTLVSLTDIGCLEDIPETGTTLKENAIIKANYVTQKYNLPCFADDTGLIVNSLNGAPGVYSARYAGEPSDAEKNMDLLLHNMENVTDRTAYFQTVICLNIHNQQHFFEGICQGEIIQQKTGSAGFGYDPIFKPDNYTLTFAEMDMQEKSKISHRGLAIKQLITFLENIQ